jgi:hypothetical protein
VERDKLKLESVGQTLPQLPTKWIIIWLPNHGYQFPTSKSTWKPNFAQIGGLLYLVVILYHGYHGNSHPFEFINPQKLPHTTVDIPTIGIGWTNFAAVAMETKKGGFKIFLDSFHPTS